MPREAGGRSELRSSAAFGLCILLLAGCTPSLRPNVPTPIPAPHPSSPANALRLLEWTYNRRDPVPYRELFTDDYRFWFSALDPAGNAYRDQPWTREDELISTAKLFQGGDANQPAATDITLSLDRDFGVFNDPRLGKAGRWHKRIRTTVALSIVAGGGQSEITGSANFYLVRGDSAMIPQELLERGFLPDSNRWYVDTWEDETILVAPGGRSVPGPATEIQLARAAPGSQLSWGRLKALYR